MKRVVLLILLLIPFNVLAASPSGMHFEKAIVYDMTDDVVRYDLNGEEIVMDIEKI